VNYTELTELYSQYKSRGVEILAFPCNQFGNQEPHGPEEIRKFVDNYNAQYQFFEKIKVNGEDAHPLYKWLKPRAPGVLGNQIKWNFAKFLISHDGKPFKRYAPNVNPMKLTGALEKLILQRDQALKAKEERMEI